MKKYDENTAEPVVIRLAETDSTNNYLRDLLAKERLPEGSVVATDFQSAGRGQVGNSWESERGQNLTFSIVVYPTSIPVRDQFLLSQVAALSVRDTFATYVDEVSVKWPNDIYWKDKKICGMLIENDVMGQNIAQSIIGIGMNINQRVFQSNAPNPVSLSQITGKDYDLRSVLSLFLSKFYTRYLQLLRDETESLRAEYRRHLFRGDGFHRFRDSQGIFDGRIAGIEPDGHLLLEDSERNVRSYAFKEVQFVLPE